MPGRPTSPSAPAEPHCQEQHDSWSRVEQHASAMGLNVTHITRACLQHWARLADENPDAAALVVTRPNASLQELADLVVKLRPSTD
jgi:hypothetical protein